MSNDWTLCFINQPSNRVKQQLVDMLEKQRKDKVMYKDNPFDKPKCPGDSVCKAQWERDRVIQDAQSLYTTLRAIISTACMETAFPAKNHPWLTMSIDIGTLDDE